MLVDVPSNREQEFRAQVASITEGRPGSSAFAEATADSRPGYAPATGEKKSFVVQIVEKQ